MMISPSGSPNSCCREASACRAMAISVSTDRLCSAHDLVVHVQHDRIAGGLDAQHRLGQQIARDAADDVLSPQTAIGAVTVPAIFELPGSVIGKHKQTVRVRRR